jgi:hypothetical protein
MSLPRLLKKFAARHPESFGFCPVEIYIPEYQLSKVAGTSEEKLHLYPKANHHWLKKDRESKEYDPDLFNKDMDANYEFVHVEKRIFHENFAFVSGCVFGDDRSWKI